MKKGVNMVAIPKKDQATHLLPVRVTESEYKKIKKATREAGDRFMTRYMRRVVMEAVSK